MNTGLPDSIVLEIFSYLPFRDLCKAAQVCQVWRRIALDNSLRTVIDVRDIPLQQPHIKKLIKTQCMTTLHDLRLRCYKTDVRQGTFVQTLHRLWKAKTLTAECLSLLEKLSPQLRCLTVEDTRLEKDLHKFPLSVQHLNLYGSVLESNLQQISRSLICLNLGQCGDIKDDDLQTLTDAPNLRVLYLEGCYRVTSRGVDRLLPILPRLQVLDLEATSVSDRGVVTLFQNCACIEELYIGHTYNKVTNAALKYLKREQMPKLSSLCAVRSRMASCMDDYVTRRLPGLHFLKLGTGSELGEERTCHHYLKHKCPVLC